jgi:hypothetical protein
MEKQCWTAMPPPEWAGKPPVHCRALDLLGLPPAPPRLRRPVPVPLAAGLPAPRDCAGRDLVVRSPAVGIPELGRGGVVHLG